MHSMSFLSDPHLDKSRCLAHALCVSVGHFTSIDEVYDFVLGYVNVEKGQATEFKLDRMRWMASELGNPHLGRVTVHVAGSKGKGSVATLIAKTLQTTGARTGLYTSPHIISWKERITESGQEIPNDIILKASEEVFALVQGKTAETFYGGELPTYFELTTLIAFCAFRLAGFEAQVIEVGLGGRLDSTNIVSPDVCVITPIELEHTQFLGSTIPLVAAEKAGIIKTNIPVCTIQPKPDALGVISGRAKDMGSPCFVVGRDILFSSVNVDVTGTCCRLEATETSPPALRALMIENSLEVRTPLVGSVYAGNMALAALALSQLPVSLNAGHIQKGFASASMPARFEIVSRSPFIVLDGAHTPESIRTILTTFLQLSPAPRMLLFACAYDKRHDEMAELLSPHFEEIIVTRPGTFKQSAPDLVFASFQKRKPATLLIESTEDAVQKAMCGANEKGAGLLVTGSFYLCAEFTKSKLCSEQCRSSHPEFRRSK
jgi:dihydrofolate synthase/folylpolyglutamate synthase